MAIQSVPQGTSFFYSRGEGRFKTEYYGVVTGQTIEGNIKYLEVLPVYVDGSVIKAYDDPNANYDRDRDNVKLRGCPPPFSELCNKGLPEEAQGVYVVANEENTQMMSYSSWLDYTFAVDGGASVSKDDMYKVEHHPWSEQKEIELTRKSFVDDADERQRILDEIASVDIEDDHSDDELDFLK